MEAIFVVAGPSGAGKSVLIDELRKKRVDGPVGAIFREGRNWTELAPKTLLQGKAEIGDASHLIIHYNTMRMAIRAGTGPEEDDKSSWVFDEPANITVVNLRLAPDRLWQHYHGRHRSGIRAWFRPQPTALLKLYRDPQLIAAWERKWDRYIAGVATRRDNIVLYDLEPLPARRFRLLDWDYEASRERR